MQDQQQPTRQELLESLRRLSDDELVARVKSLAARERRAMALLVAHLAELDTRDLHLRAGYGSLFVYCREVLALSEHEASTGWRPPAQLGDSHSSWISLPRAR